MYTVQIGSFVLNLEIVIYLLCGMAGAAGLSLRLKREGGSASAAAEVINALIVWVAVWKLSLIAFDPAAVFADLRSLIYFSGGIAGGWAATAVACGYLVIRWRRAGAAWLAIAGRLLLLLSGWMTVWFCAKFVFADQSAEAWKMGLAALISAMVFGYQLFVTRSLEWRQLAAVSAVAAAGLAAVLFVDYGGDGLERAGAGAGSVVIGLKEGQQAPDFKLSTIEGKESSLSDYSGKIVIVNFWASWCPPCKAEMPHMEKLHAKYGGRDVAIVSVNMTATEKSGKSVSSFVQKHGLTFPVMMDENGAVMEQYRVRSYPTTFLLDNEGIIRERILGAVDFAMMEKMIKKTAA
ncbi:TlpA disulfide reductase family protein [Paenibacillus sp. NEAU-GSW1]|uniref:TlpA family protein disulfide reductase n=1 Tax=Paenibacillus sp. NEAU-GSW1 TaxID=2682486 RepID=UPI0012E31693|nr:TlpA disulfide reductase family protein [Paenibacillus sp. NEAU-GSW1]MUT68798.1 redoxin domain-containing protein [Paenibacillus sp. NEAU-GSW1]